MNISALDIIATLSSTKINSHMDSAETSVKNKAGCDCQLTAINKELKLISAEINIITKWIERKFGTSIINTNSDLFNDSIYKSEEIKSLSEYLILPCNLGSPETTQQHLHNKDVRPQKGKRKRSSKHVIESNTGSATEKSLKSVSDACKNENTNELEKIRKNAAQKNKNSSLNTSKNVNTSVDDLEEEMFLINNERDSSDRKKKCTIKSKKSSIGNPGTEDEPKNHSQPKSPEKTNKHGRAKSVDWRKYACSGPKQCDECGKVVMGTSSLKQHKRMHADERPFECSECKQSFRYRKNLKIHMIALHNGERHLQCSFCGKKFYAPKDLKIHERTHTGHKPYACHLCPKRFNIKEHLTMHIRVHTGERPYKCTICKNPFLKRTVCVSTRKFIQKVQRRNRRKNDNLPSLREIWNPIHILQ